MQAKRLLHSSLMPELKLTKGFSALVSMEDLDDLTNWRWSASVARSGDTPQVYAFRDIRHSPTKVTRLYLHKYIASKIFEPSLLSQVGRSGLMLTFKNGNKLDCRRENLIISTNRVKRTNETLGKALGKSTLGKRKKRS